MIKIDSGIKKTSRLRYVYIVAPAKSNYQNCKCEPDPPEGVFQPNEQNPLSQLSPGRSPVRFKPRDVKSSRTSHVTTNKIIIVSFVPLVCYLGTNTCYLVTKITTITCCCCYLVIAFFILLSCYLDDKLCSVLLCHSVVVPICLKVVTMLINPRFLH